MTPPVMSTRDRATLMYATANGLERQSRRVRDEADRLRADAEREEMSSAATEPVTSPGDGAA